MMVISRKVVNFVVMLLLMGASQQNSISAQQTSSDKTKPQWMHKQPKPTNSSFRYETVSAIGNSLAEARDKCLAELISSSGLTTGVIISSDYKTNQTLSQKWIDGKLSEQVDYNALTSTSAKSKENEIFVENIDEYWTRDNSGKYFVTKLYAKSELSMPPLFDNVELTTKYGAQGLWRSAIVPGWGQLYKGSTLKGSLILGGTAVLIGATIYTDCVRADYSRKINKTHIAENKRTYATRRDNFTTGRNICIGALGALYVYNIIDAIVAPGARRVVVMQRNKGVSYSVLPSISTEGHPALMATITF